MADVQGPIRTRPWKARNDSNLPLLDMMEIDRGSLFFAGHNHQNVHCRIMGRMDLPEGEAVKGPQKEQPRQDDFEHIPGMAAS